MRDRDAHDQTGAWMARVATCFHLDIYLWFLLEVQEHLCLGSVEFEAPLLGLEYWASSVLTIQTSAAPQSYYV